MCVIFAKIHKRPLNRDPDVEIEFNSYWNAMWCVILTMTTGKSYINFVI